VMSDLSGKNHRIQLRQMKKKSFHLIFVFWNGFMVSGVSRIRRSGLWERSSF